MVRPEGEACPPPSGSTCDLGEAAAPWSRHSYSALPTCRRHAVGHQLAPSPPRHFRPRRRLGGGGGPAVAVVEGRQARLPHLTRPRRPRGPGRCPTAWAADVPSLP